MSHYARASTAAWYQDDYPGSVIDPNAGVLHTTEGTSLPSYNGGATAPNYTAVPDFKAKRLKWYAHFPDERSSRALRNLSGGVETNTLNVVQVELVGTCDPRTRDQWKQQGRAFIFWPQAPDWALRDLAHFVADMHARHAIKISGPKTWLAYGPDRRAPGRVPASYGDSPARFTFDQWRNFYGWCGHQHVPENAHGDPGSLPWLAIQTMARSIFAGTTPEPTAPKVSPNWDAIYQNAVRAERALGDRKAPARRRALATIKEQAARWSVRY